jgi:hypothetical protein
MDMSAKMPKSLDNDCESPLRALLDAEALAGRSNAPHEVYASDANEFDALARDLRAVLIALPAEGGIIYPRARRDGMDL